MKKMKLSRKSGVPVKRLKENMIVILRRFFCLTEHDKSKALKNTSLENLL